MENFKNLIKKAHLGNPLNEEDRATRVDKMMSGEYDDEDYKDSKRYDDIRDETEELDEMDAVSWNDKNNPTRSKAVGERDPKKVGQSTSDYSINR